MQNTSQLNKVIAFLRSHPNQRFTAREIAIALVGQYPEYYDYKRQNSKQKFVSDNDFINQIVAEISSHTTRILRNNSNSLIETQDQPRPRKYWFNHNADNEPSYTQDQILEQEIDIEEVDSKSESEIKSEQDLYPLLIQYLRNSDLYSMRLNEKRSKNNHGKHGNRWLHPDIVAMQPIPDKWHTLVQTCVQAGGGDMIHLWSFEVKKTITRSTVREYFFQTVSNSGWANYGYLVCVKIEEGGTEEELRMLSSLHGIGVIRLDIENPSESEILIPAQFKIQPDWQSINRLVEENKDMEIFMTRVASYYRSGLLLK
ncbi:COG2958 family protein [Commensalibacter oyaizuii]|uniref:HrgA protein n=1 Tax=Commensalibacter oyaizuii TaxID=3043873 RepID=A0ABT6Q2L1_9PROT|nr:HrgA protein [Commensalibacter sp. TBRC 16381]MDI2091371.1 HrgA protein [Commensalibacter sp. TBRC 16381]